MAKTLVVNGIHNYTAPEEYIPPKSAAVREHLEWFMDQKRHPAASSALTRAGR